MSEYQTAELRPLLSREQVENAFRDALVMFVGRGKRHKAQEIVEGAGVPRRILDCFRGYPLDHEDHRSLRLEQMFAIASYVGADLTTHWLRLIDQGAYNLPDIEPDPGTLAADNSDDNADLTRKALDGTFTNDCPKALTKLGTRMMNRGAHIVALAGKAA